MTLLRWRPRRRHRLPARRSLGQAVVELALILPIFLLLIAGAVDLGRLFYAYLAIVNASKEGALYGASNPVCDTAAVCRDPQNVVWHVQSEAGNLEDSSGAPLTPTITCLAAGSPIGDLSNCHDGYTYRVTVDYNFRLITPILGSVFGRGLTLHAESEATVLNKAVNPNPGVSVTKTVWNEITKQYERTPEPDATGKLIPIEVSPGDLVKYRLTVRNSGGLAMAGLTISDVPHGLSGCPSLSSMGVGGLWTCDYTKTYTGSDLGGQPFRLLTDTVTVDGPDISQVEDSATIKLVANPPELQVSKSVNVYRHDSPFGTETELDVARSSAVHPTVWYRILVKNTGGLPATGFAVRDSFGTLPRDSDCPSVPSSLDPNETYACFYARTFTGTGSFGNTVTVDSRETSPVTDRATVVVATCSAGSEVVPNMVENSNGDPRTVSEARGLWSAAGFTGTFNPQTGFDSREVTDQDRRPFECRVASVSVTVDHK
jgi:uncharacterized repeat protein (TIGR01451 family)